jgi:hypothetical protein
MVQRSFPSPLLAALIAGTLYVLSHPSLQTRGAQGPGSPQLPDYAGVRTVADWSPDELRHHIPELKGLEPATSPEEASAKLSPILTKVGENVRAFFDNFPNSTSVERIHTDFMYGDGRLRRDFSQEYNYLMLAAPGKGRATLEEFRTEPGSNAAKRVRPGGVFITEGFASSSIHFHPSYQGDSVFRYLGRQRVGGQEAEVVAFAQRPGIARNTGELSVGSNSLQILVQGVAWVDSATYQIRRLRTDMLAPCPELGVERETTIIQYGAVYFKGITQVNWLPKEVEVIVTWKNTTLHNDHAYSHFRLFSVESEHRESPPK